MKTKVCLFVFFFFGFQRVNSIAVDRVVDWILTQIEPPPPVNVTSTAKQRACDVHTNFMLDTDADEEPAAAKRPRQPSTTTTTPSKQSTTSSSRRHEPVSLLFADGEADFLLSRSIAARGGVLLSSGDNDFIIEACDSERTVLFVDFRRTAIALAAAFEVLSRRVASFVDKLMMKVVFFFL